MHNDPELQIQGKYLGTITKDFAKISHLLKEAAYQMKKQGISNYPIFPICKESLKIGKLLLSKEEISSEWNFYISYAEIFRQQGLITDEHFSDFEQVYKPIEEFCCLFVVDQEFMNFVFLPYPQDEEEPLA